MLTDPYAYLRRHVSDVKAVDDVSFTIEEGTTVGLVGESGSGKSTIGKTLLKLVPATAGSVQFLGTPALADQFSGKQTEPMAQEDLLCPRHDPLTKPLQTLPAPPTRGSRRGLAIRWWEEPAIHLA